MPRTNGLDAAHDAERKRQVGELAAAPGAPCPRSVVCGGQPMYATTAQALAAGQAAKWWCPHCGRWQTWTVDLDDFPGRWFGGPQVKALAHAHCNRSAGARFGNRLRGLRSQAWKDAGLTPPRSNPGRPRGTRTGRW